MPKIYIAYRLNYSKRSKGIETLHAFQCYSCHKFHSTKNFFDKHLTVYSQAAGIIYKFDNKSIVTFEDNYRFFRDLPFVAYFDFETTAGRDLFLDKKMYVFTYCSIFAFHSK